MRHKEYEWQTADGVGLYGQEWSSDTSPLGLICLVHGLGEHSGHYAHMAAYLAEKGYAVVTFDLRGHGKSQGSRGHTPSYEALMQDIGSLVEQASNLFPGVPCFLYGHSLGGNLVLNYVLRNRPQLAGVIATGPALRTSFQPPMWKILLARIMCFVWPSMPFNNGIAPGGLSHDSQVGKAAADDPLNHHVLTPRLGIGFLDAGIWALEHAGECSIPLLLMHGSADPITSPDASCQFARQASCECTLKLWDGFYHEIHNETEKEEVFEFLVNWLNDHLPA